MNEPRATEVAPIGRPSLGALMQDAFHIESWRRESRRNLRPLSRLLPLLAAHKLDAVLGISFLLAATGSQLALTSGGRTVLDKSVSSSADLMATFIWLGVAALVMAVATGLRVYFTQKLAERVVVDLRKAVFRHALDLDPGHYLNMRTGEVLSRMTTDMTIVERTLGGVVPGALRNIMLVVGSLVLMVVVSPSFTGLILAVIPFILAPLLVMGRRIRSLSVSAQDRFAESIGVAGEGLEAVETVQAFGQEDVVSGQFNTAVEAAFVAARAQLRAKGVMSALMISVTFAGLLTLLYMCASRVFIHHTMTAGALLQIVALAFFAATAMRDLSEVWGDVQKASGAAERIAGMIDARPAIAAPANPTSLPDPPRGEVSFENVTFAYPGRHDQPALNGFTLRVRPGERIALVGPSGAGKSTVLRLLLRFYDPDAGVVKIDGVDLAAADPHEVRERLALVAQDAPMFSGSASENISFGRTGASEDEVRAAALAAQAEGFILSLPQAFATPMGERAKTLSGGQRQRLAIARALIRRSPILLLDEATSALDAENERLVQQALHEAMEGRTTLVIAHRLATVLEADRIIVMDQGRVVEEGRHPDLISRGGLYARLAKLQFAAEAA